MSLFANRFDDKEMKHFFLRKNEIPDLYRLGLNGGVLDGIVKAGVT